MKNFITLGALLLALVSVSKAQTIIKSRNGIYTIMIYKSYHISDPVIFGYVKQFENNFPVTVPKLKVDKAFYINANNISGYYLTHVIHGKHRISAFGMGFKGITTNKIKFQTGDSVRITFMLKADTTPFDKNNTLN